MLHIANIKEVVMQVLTPSTSRNAKQLGEHVRNWRKIHKLTQKNLAGRAKITRQALAKIEQGNPHARLDDILSILEILGQEKKMLDSLDPLNDSVARLRWGMTEKERVR